MKPILFLLLTLLFACNTQTNNEPTQQEPEALYSYDIEERLADLNIKLKPVRKLPPTVQIERVIKSGNLLYLSGNGPLTYDGELITGKVGKDLTIEQGAEAARITGINQLAVLKEYLGDLNKVEKIVKVFGMVNASPEFTKQPLVINGCTNLLIEVFGERGKHARSAVGMASLPGNMACEIEMIVQIRE